MEARIGPGTTTGSEVLGIDISPSMIEFGAEERPAGHLPACWFAADGEAARVCLDHIYGECVNYLFDMKSGKPERLRFFHRVHRALKRGGLFVFDFAEPARVPDRRHRRPIWSEGRDWLIVVETTGNRERRRLTRRIISFRKTGVTWRRSEETHRLQLYDREELAVEVRNVGFEVEVLKAYGKFPLLPGTAALLARKA